MQWYPIRQICHENIESLWCGCANMLYGTIIDENPTPRSLFAFFFVKAIQ
jgi:hypothetical protein